MEADFTLVPIGGLGNRINAICSAIVYCRQNNKSLRIIWFKDPGLNCSVKKLFYLNTDLDGLELHDATFSDLILRDNPRRKNLWIPKFFQQFLYDRKIYESEFYRVIERKLSFNGLSDSKHLFMISCWRYWESPDMWNSRIILQPEILSRINQIVSAFPTNIIGIHIRRSDNNYSIKYSPTDSFIEKMEKEILQDKDVSFYVASDSIAEKKQLKKLFGDRVITQMKETSRNNESGIIDAFVEMNVLSKTKKIYASAFSSFSELASFFTNIECITVTNNSENNEIL